MAKLTVQNFGCYKWKHINFLWLLILGRRGTLACSVKCLPDFWLRLWISCHHLSVLLNHALLATLQIPISSGLLYCSVFIWLYVKLFINFTFFFSFSVKIKNIELATPYNYQTSVGTSEYSLVSFCLSLKVNCSCQLLVLGRTHCVDTTITNFLEGRVSYLPEKESSKVESSSDVNGSPTRISNEVRVVQHLFFEELRV